LEDVSSVGCGGRGGYLKIFQNGGS